MPVQRNNQPQGGAGTEGQTRSQANNLRAATQHQDTQSWSRPRSVTEAAAKGDRQPFGEDIVNEQGRADSGSEQGGKIDTGANTDHMPSSLGMSMPNTHQ